MTASRPAATGDTSTIYRAPQLFNQAAVYVVALLVPIFALVPIVAIRNDLKQHGTISLATITLSLVVLLVIVVAFCQDAVGQCSRNHAWKWLAIIAVTSSGSNLYQSIASTGSVYGPSDTALHIRVFRPERLSA